MSLDFQRMRSVGTVAGRFVGETSIADRTSHQKGGVGCAEHVDGAWLGEQKNTAECSAESWTRLHARPSHSVSPAAGCRAIFNSQLEDTTSWAQLRAISEKRSSTDQTQIF